MAVFKLDWLLCVTQGCSFIQVSLAPKLLVKATELAQQRITNTVVSQLLMEMRAEFYL